MTIAAANASSERSETGHSVGSGGHFVIPGSDVSASRFTGRHFLGADGRYYPEITDSQGRPLSGVVQDPQTGAALPVGRQAYDPATGRPMPGKILVNGQILPGVPLAPSCLDESGNPRPCQDPTASYPQETIGTDGRPIPGYPQTGYPGATDGRPIPSYPGAGYPGASYPGAAFPGYPGADGRPIPGYPGTGPSSQIHHAPHLPMTGESMPGTRPEVDDGQGSPHRIIRIPAPSYPLLNGTYAPLAVGSDGRPMDGYCHDETTGNIARVGLAYYDPVTRQQVPGMIVDPETGRPIPGEPVDLRGWHALTKQPLPHYLTTSGQWVPMHVDEDGTLAHGFAAPLNGSGPPQPVGLQVVDSAGRAIPGIIVGPDGQKRQGIALSTFEEGSMGGDKSLQSRPGSGTTLIRETSQLLGPSPPSDSVKYVEVPVVEQRVVRVKKPVYQEVERRVPVVQVQEVEKIVEVPQVEYLDRHVEVEQIEEIVREIPVRKVIDRPYEVVVERPRVEIKMVEKVVEVPGQIIEVPVVKQIENPIYVPHYSDREVPTVVAQKLQPVIHASKQSRRVDCQITEPKIITVDVFIPKPVQSVFVPTGRSKESHTTVDIPPAQYNALVRRLNENVDQTHIAALLTREGAGVPILPAGERVETVEPVVHEWARTHQPGRIRVAAAPGVMVPPPDAVHLAQPAPAENKHFAARGVARCASGQAASSYNSASEQRTEDLTENVSSYREDTRPRRSRRHEEANKAEGRSRRRNNHHWEPSEEDSYVESMDKRRAGDDGDTYSDSTRDTDGRDTRPSRRRAHARRPAHPADRHHQRRQRPRY